MLKKIVVLAVVVFGLTAAPALAQQYPPEDKHVDVSAMSPCPGDTITVTAATFAPGSSVTIELAASDVLLGTATADDAGAISHDVVVPESQTPGQYDIRVSGVGADGSEVALTAAIEVRDCDEDDEGAPAVASPSSGLPVTGSDTMTLVKIGLALAALGGLLLALARRRRTTAGIAA